MFLILAQLDLATSGKGGFGTFIGICAISAAFGIADAHVQGGMVGDLSFMPVELIQVSIVFPQFHVRCLIFVFPCVFEIVISF